ncbi:major facilitator superfamily domain-containing protein [Xylariales sp. PMI_506]|nr:major facilitator superfamily domain-containing protein [Xylariales sp. PMI_506]
MSTSLDRPQSASVGASGEKDPEKIQQIDGADVGLTALTGAITHIDPNGEEARRVLRKIDWHLLPLLSVTYMIQYIDKTCVSYAALWGMKTDAHLIGSQYAWLTTIFYLGYLVFEFPVGILFQKFNIAKVCGIFITLWGVVLLCTTAANDFAGLATARFLLGALEAGVSPCFVLMTSMFYKRSEQPFRTGIWFSMNGVASIIGSLIGYGIGHIHASIAAWKFPFVIFGSATIVWGMVFFWFAPSNPTQARWLTAEEKEIAVLRLVENETGIDNKTIKWYQVREALADPRFWLINLYMLINCIPNGGVTAFGPLIVNSFGFTTFESTLLNMPAGAAQIMALWITGFVAAKVKGSRHLLMIGGNLVATLGSALIYALPDEKRVGRVLGYYLFAGFSAAFVLGLGLLQANVAGRTKKNVFTSSVFVSYCIGNLIGPQTFLTREAPRYQTGFAIMIGCFVAQIFLLVVMYILNTVENNKVRRFSPPILQEDLLTAMELDLTQILARSCCLSIGHSP